jgi:hypothetical protein
VRQAAAVSSERRPDRIENERVAHDADGTTC